MSERLNDDDPDARFEFGGRIVRVLSAEEYTEHYDDPGITPCGLVPADVISEIESELRGG